MRRRIPGDAAAVAVTSSSSKPDTSYSDAPAMVRRVASPTAPSPDRSVLSRLEKPRRPRCASPAPSPLARQALVKPWPCGSSRSAASPTDRHVKARHCVVAYVADDGTVFGHGIGVGDRSGFVPSCPPTLRARGPKADAANTAGAHGTANPRAVAASSRSPGPDGTSARRCPPLVRQRVLRAARSPQLAGQSPARGRRTAVGVRSDPRTIKPGPHKDLSSHI